MRKTSKLVSAFFATMLTATLGCLTLTGCSSEGGQETNAETDTETVEEDAAEYRLHAGDTWNDITPVHTNMELAGTNWSFVRVYEDGTYLTIGDGQAIVQESYNGVYIVLFGEDGQVTRIMGDEEETGTYTQSQDGGTVTLDMPSGKVEGKFMGVTNNLELLFELDDNHIIALMDVTAYTQELESEALLDVEYDEEAAAEREKAAEAEAAKDAATAEAAEAESGEAEGDVQ